MKRSLLIEAYATLDRRELQEFTQFLNSPWFNQSELLQQLHEVLSGLYPDFEGIGLEKAHIFPRLYPGQPYDDRKIRVLMSKLLGLLERFWIQKSLESHEFEQKKLLLRQLSRRNANRIFARTIQSAQQWLEEHRSSQDEYFHEKFLLSELEALFQIEVEGRRAGDEGADLVGPILFLDHYYIIHKLRFLCVARTLENIKPGTYQSFLSEELPGKLTPEHLKVPLIALLKQNLLCLNEMENPNHFRELRQLLHQHDQELPEKMALELHTYAQNYCVRKINLGESDFLPELFGLYRDGIEKSILFTNGQLSPWMYKNITVTGLRLGEFQWIETFLFQYKTTLPEEEQANAFTYNFAKYHFYRQNYSEVIQLLMQVEYNDVFYGLDSRAMLLKTYYELSEVEALDSLAQSFRIFLRRKKSISENYRRGYLNLIKFVKKLSRMVFSGPQQLQKLEEEIHSSQPVMDVGWLEEKLAELA